MTSLRTHRTPLSALKVVAAAAALSWGYCTDATAASYASVLINSLSYTTSSGTLTWSDPYQSFHATAMNAGGLVDYTTDGLDTADWNFAIVGASTSRATAAISTTAPQTFWATASTTTSTGALSSLPNQADSAALQSGSFALSTAGSVTFLLNYTLMVSAAGGNIVSDYATALLSLDAANNAGNSGGTVGSSLLSFSQASGTASETGTLSMTVNLAANEAGFYSVRGNADAFSNAALPVPEPGSWALLTTGLLATLGWARLRRRG